MRKFSFNFAGPVKNFTAQGIEFLYNEANGKAGDPVAGFLRPGWPGIRQVAVGPWTATPSLLSLKWNRPDAILQESAFATAATSTGFPTYRQPTPSPVTGIPIPGEGQGCAKGFNAFPAFPPCVFAPNGLTNATYVDPRAFLISTRSTTTSDFIVNNQIQDGITRLPINLMLELLDNPDAAAHPLG